MSHTAAGFDLQAVDQLQSLEERIVQVVELLREARAGRHSAETRVAELEQVLVEQSAQLKETEERAEAASREHRAEADGLRQALAEREAEVAAARQHAAAAEKEREEVRRRVEKLLRQVDSLIEG